MNIYELKGYIETLYLVEVDEQLLLLDSGCRCDVKVVKEFIENKLNKKMSDLKLVIITHAHPDHSGGAYFYKKMFNIKLAGPEGINLWYSGIKGFFTYAVDVTLTYLVAFRKKRGFLNIIFPRKIELDYILKDRDLIPGFSMWLALSSPGHTANDLTIYCPHIKTAYIADIIVGSPKGYFRPYPLSFPDQYKNSLQRLMDLEIEDFLLAHHGKNKIPYSVINKLLGGTPVIPRIHKNTLGKILKQFLKAFLR